VTVLEIGRKRGLEHKNAQAGAGQEKGDAFEGKKGFKGGKKKRAPESRRKEKVYDNAITDHQAREGGGGEAILALQGRLDPFALTKTTGRESTEKEEIEGGNATGKKKKEKKMTGL